MKLKEKIVLLVLISLAGCIYCPAQDFDFYKKQAYKCFDDGEYEKAQKALNMYNEMTGNKITGLSEKVALCLNYQASAKKAEQSGDYASAKSYYESILECNPKDPNVSATIARLNALVAALREKERLAAEKQRQEDERRQQQNANLQIQMVFVKGGTFTMGVTPQGSDYDDVKHCVTLSDYYIGKYEVTQGQWKAVMGTTVYQQRDKANTSLPMYGVGDNYPMYYVNYYDAQEFVQKLNERTGKRFTLPTEAQWEYAARGGNRASGTKYSGSRSIDDVAWYEDNSRSTTHPVGTKSPNELGLYDMSGNVYEWCADWYDEDYYQDSPSTNPRGPSSGSCRVLRGGCWINIAGSCRVSHRYSLTPDNYYSFIGFRLVLIP